MQNYRKLLVWQKAHEFVSNIYENTKGFPRDELYGITSQLRRASVSISANIVEGAGRKTRSDFARFLTISLGSTNEVEYFLILSKDLNCISMDEYTGLADRLVELRKMLSSLAAKVRSI